MSKAEPMFMSRQRKLLTFESASLYNNKYIMKAVSSKVGKLLQCNPVPVCILPKSRMRLSSTIKYVKVIHSEPVVEIYRGPLPAQQLESLRAQYFRSPIK